MRGRARIEQAERDAKPKGGRLRMGVGAGLAVLLGLVVVRAGHQLRAPAEGSAPVAAPVAYVPVIIPPSKPMAAVLTDSTQATMHTATAQQVAFLEVLTQSRKGFQKGDNDLRKGAARMSRASALCQVVPDTSVKDWIGVVSGLSSNGEGKGVVSVQVGRDAYLTTWSDAYSDMGHGTLIPASSPVHAVAMTLSRGDKVRFSGRFFHDEQDCLYEASYTQRGSMAVPEFIFRFDAMSKLP